MNPGYFERNQIDHHIKSRIVSHMKVPSNTNNIFSIAQHSTTLHIYIKVQNSEQTTIQCVLDQRFISIPIRS